MNIKCERCGQNMGFTTIELSEKHDFYCINCKSKLLEGMSVNRI